MAGVIDVDMLIILKNKQIIVCITILFVIMINWPGRDFSISKTVYLNTIGTTAFAKNLTNIKKFRCNYDIKHY